MPVTFDPSGANNMTAIKDRITRTLAEATRDMSPLETFANVGKAASQAATGHTTFGDALNAMNAKRIEATRQMMQVLQQDRQIGLQERADARAERGMALQEKQLELQQRQADLQASIDRERMGLERAASGRADEQLKLQKNQFAYQQLQDAAASGSAAGKAVVSAIESLVPEGQRAIYAAYMADLPYSVDASNAVHAIGHVRTYLEQNNLLPDDMTEDTALMTELKSAGLEPGTPEYRQAVLGAKTRPQVVLSGDQFGAKQAAERQSAYIEASGLAAGTVAATKRMTDLLARGTETGSLQGGRLLLRGMAEDLGLPIDDEKLGQQQEFDRLSKDLTLNSMQRFKGAMSERELDFGVSTVAGLGKSEDGNIRALAALQAAAEIALENTNRMAQADSASDLRKIEAEIAQRNADEIIKRTEELETEIRARIALSRQSAAGNVTIDSVRAMTPQQAGDLVKRLGTEGLRTLDQSLLEELNNRLDQQ